MHIEDDWFSVFLALLVVLDLDAVIEALGISILPLLIGTNKRESLCRLAVFCHLPLRPRSDDACCFDEAWCFVFGGTYELLLDRL